jgi:hypothetical protein
MRQIACGLRLRTIYNPKLFEGDFMRYFLFVAATLLATTSAQAASFDGEWTVTQACPDAKEAKGYTIHYPATVKGAEIHGQFRKVGETPSMTLTGTIQPDGTAAITVTGLTGNPKYSLKNVATGSPVNFSVTGKFDDGKGTGTRTSGRPCNFTFVKK